MRAVSPEVKASPSKPGAQCDMAAEDDPVACLTAAAEMMAAGTIGLKERIVQHGHDRTGTHASVSKYIVQFLHRYGPVALHCLSMALKKNKELKTAQKKKKTPIEHFQLGIPGGGFSFEKCSALGSANACQL